MHFTASPFDPLALALDSANGTFLDHAATLTNLRRSARRIVANAGAAGVDEVTVREFANAWPRMEADVRSQLLDGSYQPAPVRKCPVPKPGGKGPRMLGIPTVLDRTLQLALAQPLSALLDPYFSPFSHGFRPGRCAHDALLQAAAFIEDGLTWVLHLDLEKFFDRAPHDLVLARLAQHVDDPRLLALVERFLTVPFAGRKAKPRTQGLPQGSPLSPLLANLLLDGLDQRLFDAGFAFCRYADDICIYAATVTEAREAFAMIAPWIEHDLKLVINREKTRVLRVWDDDFLGYQFQPRRGRVAFCPSEKSRLRLRLALGRLLARHRTHNPSEIIGAAVMPLVRGWSLYFRLCEDGQLFAGLDRWVVQMLRRWLVQRASDPRRRARHLIKRGVPHTTAWSLIAKHVSISDVADSPAIRRAFPLSWLRTHGWQPCLTAASQAGRADPAPFSSPASTALLTDLDRGIRACDLYEWPARPTRRL